MMLASQSRKSYIKLDHFLLSSVLSPAFLSTFQVINFSLVTWGWLMVTWPIKGPFSKCGFAGQMMWLPSNSSLQCNVDLQTSRSHQGHRGQIYWPLQFVTVAAQGVTPALPAQVSTLSGKHVAYEKYICSHNMEQIKERKQRIINLSLCDSFPHYPYCIQIHAKDFGVMRFWCQSPKARQTMAWRHHAWLYSLFMSIHSSQWIQPNFIASQYAVLL